jgi:hypothetical protein
VVAELERVQKGALILMPRAEFEAKIQQAALAVERLSMPPRLTKARYKAQLTNQSLVGTAEWSVTHTVSSPGILALSPDFNLALGDRIKVDGKDGILGELQARKPVLWIPKSGQATVQFDWSRRGTQTNAGLHFDLHVPSCANAQIELTLPIDWHPETTQPGVLLEGPFSDRDSPVHKNVDTTSWLLSFSGDSRVMLDLRRRETSAALILAALKSRQELGPDRVLADFEFDVEALHGNVVELVFDADGTLQPYEVTLNGVEVKNWQWAPSPNTSREQAQNDLRQADGSVLVVPLPKPYYGRLPKIQICCLTTAAEKKDRVWISPWMRLRGAVQRGETVELTVLPETHPENWHPGEFRLLKSDAKADGSQLFTLVHNGVSPERPSAVLKSRGAEFLLEQQSWWQIDWQGSTLVSELMCKPSRGEIYHMPFKLPPESQVEQLTAQPKESLRSWATAGSRQSPILLIDLMQPAKQQSPVKITLRLRLPPSFSTQNSDLRDAVEEYGKRPVTIDLPDIEPLLPCLRDGALAVSVNPSCQPYLEPASWPASAPPPGADSGPWRQAALDYYFTFRGKPLTGKIRLLQRASQFQANCQSEATLVSNLGTLTTRLTLEPTSGSLDHVDLLVSAGLAEPWRVRHDQAAPRVASVQRLTGLEATPALLAVGASHGLEALSIFALNQRLQHWRVSFAEPVRNRGTIVLEAPFKPLSIVPDASRPRVHVWDVPIVRVTGADHFDGELTVQMLGADVIAQDGEQLREVARPPARTLSSRAPQPVWRVFRYDGSASAVRLPRLQVEARAAFNELAGLERCDEALLATLLEPGGKVTQRLQFRLANWRKRDIPVFLPPGAKLLGARIEGRWLPPIGQQDREEGVQVELPANLTTNEQSFELHYSLPVLGSTWAPWETLPAPLPKLPVRPLNLRQRWVLPTSVLPMEQSFQRVATTDGHDQGELEWEPAAALEPYNSIVVVRPLALHVIGISVGVIMGAIWVLSSSFSKSVPAAQQSQKSQPWRARCLICWIAFTVGLAFWLPTSLRPIAAFPAIMSAVLGIVNYLTAVFRQPSPSAAAFASSSRSVIAAATVLLILSLAASTLPMARSQDSDTGKVLILPGPSDGPDRQDVVVSPELLKTLDTLIERGQPGFQRAILISGTYDGKIIDDLVDFKARFQIHSFGQKTSLTIPLEEVELSDGAFLDDAPIQPIATPDGYLIMVNNAGPHQLTLPFTARIHASAKHRDLRFSLPRLLHSRLAPRLPVDWPEPQVLSGLGEIRPRMQSKPAPDMIIELGPDPLVHLRWSSNNPTASTAKVSVREAYSWDLRTPASLCTAMFTYTVTEGNVERFRWMLPESLEPIHVDVFADPQAKDETTRAQLSDWQVSEMDGGRHLIVRLQQPISNGAKVLLNLAPRFSVGPGAVRLQLLEPLDASLIGGVLAYRVSRFEAAAKPINMKLVPLPVEDFTQQWAEVDHNEAVKPTLAFTIGNQKSEASSVSDLQKPASPLTEERTLIVTLTPRRPSFEQDLMWTLHPGRADLQATLRATIAEEELLLIEWDVPPQVTIAQINGDNVRSWARASGESRVQVWLKQPAPSVSISLSGWVLHDKVGGLGLRWPLPWLRCANAANTRTIVRIAESGGVTARPDGKKLVNLVMLPTSGQSSQGLSNGTSAAWLCQGPQDFYRAEFVLRQIQPPARASALSTVEVRDGFLMFEVHLLIDLPHSGTSRLVLALEDWQGPPLRLDGFGDLSVREMPGSSSQQRWQVVVPAGAPRHSQLKLIGSRACPAGTTFEIPHLHLEGAQLHRQWLALRSPTLAPQTSHGLTEIKELGLEPELAPGFVERLTPRARLWKTTGVDWKVLVAYKAPVVLPTYQVIRSDQELSLGAGYGWIHHSAWSIYANDSSEWFIDLPAGALLLAASINGEQVNPRFATQDRLEISLPAGRRSADAPNQLVLRWTLGPESEPLAKPQLIVPRLDSASPVAVNCTLAVPTGYRLSQETDGNNYRSDKEANAANTSNRTTNIHWRMQAQDETPQIKLVSIESVSWRWKWRATFWVTLMMAFSLALTLMPRAAAIFMQLWPEQFMLLAFVGWVIWGWNVAVLLLMVVGTVTRLLRIRAWLRNAGKEVADGHTAGIVGASSRLGEAPVLR